jgi:outer membrane protein OmpA-like peptidoglycan-associated protein
MAGHAIFIGYRREDTADVGGRIYDGLVRHFGRRRIFKDVDDLRPGADFGAYITTILPQCRVFLALIGPRWIEARDQQGNRRLDDPHDWVRVEIETALATPGLDVVPVLVSGAEMPRAQDLPESLLPILRRQAAIVRRDPDFHDDVGRLAAALKGSLRVAKSGVAEPRASVTESAKRSSRLIWPIALAAAALLAIATGFALAMRTTPELADQTASASNVVPTPDAATAAVSRAAPTEAADAAAWREVENSRSPEALRQFVETYRASEFSIAAEQKLDELDRAAWLRIDNDDISLEALQRYLRQFPEGGHAEKAREWASTPTSAQHVSGPTSGSCNGLADNFVAYFYADSMRPPREVVEMVNASVDRIPNPVMVHIVGHDDTAGPAGYSMDVSRQRAMVIRDLFLARGVPAGLIGTWASGELDSVRGSTDGLREPLDRRVAVTIC